MGWMNWLTSSRRSIEEIDNAVEDDRIQELLGDRRRDYDSVVIPSIPQTAVAAHSDAIYELCQAIRLTVEYVGTAMLPAEPGWSWYDALAKYDPAAAYLAKVPRLLPDRDRERELCDCHRPNGLHSATCGWYREQRKGQL